MPPPPPPPLTRFGKDNDDQDFDFFFCQDDDDDDDDDAYHNLASSFCAKVLLRFLNVAREAPGGAGGGLPVSRGCCAKAPDLFLSVRCCSWFDAERGCC